MQFHPDEFYHIYNRGNNKQQIFFNEDNYIFFLSKVRHYILPHCEILNYTLMPNHFHLLIYTKNILYFNDSQHPLVRGIASMLSSYTQAINRQQKTTGSLFQQKTKAKCLSQGSAEYCLACFHYIHQNAWKAGLVDRMEDWKFSSFKDYAGFRMGTLCNKKLAYELLDIKPDTFYKEAYIEIDNATIGVIS